MNKKYYIAFAGLVAATALFYLGYIFIAQIRSGNEMPFFNQVIAP